METEITSMVKGQGSPDLNLPYRGGILAPMSLPHPPRSVHVTNPYLVGVQDIRWDNPAKNPYNQSVQVLGVNVYRAFDAPGASYTKLNETPVSSLFWRDRTREVFIDRELATERLNPGINPEKKWYFHTSRKPIIVPDTNANGVAGVSHVLVEVDAGDGKGFVPVIPFRVVAEEGLVYLNTNRTYNPTLNTFVPPVLPDPLMGGVRVSYTYLDGLIASDMNRKIYYKVTTVALNPKTSTEIETPLSEVPASTQFQMEATDWIWKEAIRRNRWLLEQTGERVKLFVRKWNGVRCDCADPNYGYSKRQGTTGTCTKCYGTTFVGGYEGPFDIIIAPPETEKSVNLMDAGIHITYDWNTWTGPEPLLNDRDVIVRANNDRLFVNRANPQGSRGATYQQHFSLVHIDQTDAVYYIPIRGGELIVPPGWNAFREERANDASPTIPVTSHVPEGALITGRTVTFENITT